MIDRTNVNRALAKAIAYQQCGKAAEARAWGRELVRLLQMADILAGGPPEPSARRARRGCCAYHDGGGVLQASCGGDAPRSARRRTMPDGEKDQLDYAWNEPGAPFRSGDY
jgi:hypothetical protein